MIDGEEKVPGGDLGAKKPNPLQLINNMRGDIVTCQMTKQQLIVEGPALDALLEVVEVARRATELRLVMSVPENGNLTICVDFDGVLHSYISGWQGADKTSDPPVRGAIEWLREMIYYKRGGEGSDRGDRLFNIAIYSSRSQIPGGIDAMQKWFLRHGLEKQDVILLFFPERKPAAFLTIDDRAICFEGTFPTPEQIRSFQPWVKKRMGENDG